MEYSFVVPVFNDHYLLGDFCAELRRVMRAYVGGEIEGRVELIVVDDGSAVFDRAAMEALCRSHPFVRVVRLSRNFGQHIALSCGYRLARGKYVGMLNADMEDHPDQIPLLLDRIRESDLGIVHGLRRRRQGKLSIRLTSYAFYTLLNKLTGYDVPLNVATLRVMSRQFVDAYNALAESSRYIPGLEMWLGFPRAYVPIDHRNRTQGTSTYRFRTRLRMAIDSILSFSDLPLKFVAVGGLIVALVGLLLAVGLIISKLAFIDYTPGYASTTALIVLLGGVQILVVGVASLYIGRILREVQHRPLYVIQEAINLAAVDRAGR